MNKKLADIFFSTPKLSIKNNTYFDIYMSLFLIPIEVRR